MQSLPSQRHRISATHSDGDSHNEPECFDHQLARSTCCACRMSSSTAPGDWYLRHLELMSIVPALVAGYVTARGRDSVATWAWIVPLIALFYEMFRFHAPSSVLTGASMSTFRYFFCNPAKYAHIDQSFGERSGPLVKTDDRHSALLCRSSAQCWGVGVQTPATKVVQPYRERLRGL